MEGGTWLARLGLSVGFGLAVVEKNLSFKLQTAWNFSLYLVCVMLLILFLGVLNGWLLEKHARL